MKNTLTLWLLFAMLVLSSCSEQSKIRRLLEQVPEQTDVVVVADVKTIFNSAGGTVEGGKVVLPDYITGRLSGKDARELDEVLDFISTSGIDLDAAAIVVADIDKNPTPVVVVALDDKKKFLGTLEDEEFDEKDSDDNFTYYAKRTYESGYSSDYDTYFYIGVSDDFAYLLPDVSASSDVKPVKLISRMAADAADGSFASTPFADYIIDDDSALGLAFRFPRQMQRELRNAGIPPAVLSMYKGTVCARTSLSDDEATMRFRFLDENGKALDFSWMKDAMDTKARVSAKALSYLNANEFAVGAFAMRDIDWGAITDAMASQPGMPAQYRMAMGVARTYLENIDGTVALGLGLTDGLRSVACIDYNMDVMKQFAATLVVETKPGKASGMASELRSFAEQLGAPVNDGSNGGFSIEIPGAGGSIYVGGDDDVLVISNLPVTDVNTNEAVKSFDLTDYLSAGVVYLPHTNPLMSQLGIDADVRISGISLMPEFESESTLRITGMNTKGIIARLAQVVTSVAESEDIYRRLRREVRDAKYGRADDYDYADTTAVEVITVE